MRKVLLQLTLLLSLLASGAVAAFIQNPIPPSSKRNFYRDVDGDGRMDRIDIRFLGGVSQKYIDDLFDSLTFDWIDTLGEPKHFVVKKSGFAPDSADRYLIHVDLKKIQKQFMPLTALSTMDYSSSIYGSSSLYLSDSTVFPLNLRDGMAPSIASVQLKSHRGKGVDSLKIRFTEMVTPMEGCSSLLEFKTEKDSAGRELPASVVRWDAWGTEALFEFDDKVLEKNRLYPRDSLRLLSKCIGDTSSNIVAGTEKFIQVSGFFPLEISIPSMSVEDENPVFGDVPIFQVVFENADDVVEDSLWQISMEVLGNEFENALREKLGLDEKEKINLKKLKFRFNVKIYTNLGTYVVGTQTEVKGDDSHFVSEPMRLSLRWNFMDSNHRRVGTGAYLANVLVFVEYEGKTVFRNDREQGFAVRVFGVKRR